MSDEVPITFDCAGEELVGIIHGGHCESKIGVVFIVGGPQYRVGSHRMFVLLARVLARTGISVLRFDYRGMGDSTGEPREFMRIKKDVEAATRELRKRVPSVEKVVLFGLCDAASAILTHDAQDKNVMAYILLNPWVRSAATYSKSRLRYYYPARLLQKTFWRKAISGKLSFFGAATDLTRNVKDLLLPSVLRTGDISRKEKLLFDSMREGLVETSRPVLLVLSGRDLVAREFLEFCKADAGWRKALQKANIEIAKLPNADHTFSKRADLDYVGDICVNWLTNLAQVKTRPDYR